eukprot:CAMPEP_0196573266 /NCGR_PEP_ID=MMETSP1081-20130531/3193_1 /TAXON_ID=36882 /ORGANISM="Pyramimonas amylifera, Strain CCMP720" /LENGTH=351 /DNA_ID=CAMNT_0041890915 /DNA_START=99 /DNA_END=1154 /DNA_ORIENTATION=-
MALSVIQSHALYYSLSQNKRTHTKKVQLALRAFTHNKTNTARAISIDENTLEFNDSRSALEAKSARRNILASIGLSLLWADKDFILPASADECKKVFVAGATGQTGRLVVEELKRRGIAVRAGVRDLKKAEALGLTAGDSASVELILFDVTDDVTALMEAIGDADAVVCVTGLAPTAANWGGLRPGSSIPVEKVGTSNLVKASKELGTVEHFVLVSSVLANAVACNQTDNPNYKILQAFGGILTSKREAEIALQTSGLDYTIVRPGGLTLDPPGGNVATRGADTLFARESDPGDHISRTNVASIAVEALFQTQANRKIVEVVESGSEENRTPKNSWFDVPIAPSDSCANPV